MVSYRETALELHFRFSSTIGVEGEYRNILQISMIIVIPRRWDREMKKNLSSGDMDLPMVLVWWHN